MNSYMLSCDFPHKFYLHVTLSCPCSTSVITHLTELAKAHILSRASGLVAGSQCCIICSHKVWHRSGVQEATQLFVPARHPSPGHWAASGAVVP